MFRYKVYMLILSYYYFEKMIPRTIKLQVKSEASLFLSQNALLF